MANVYSKAGADAAIAAATASAIATANPATMQGVYARSHPLPDSGYSFRALARDPYQAGVNGTGRVWGVGGHFGQIGYTDDDGATFVAKSGPLDSPLQGMLFSTSWLWILTQAGTAPSSGNVWRIPLPDVNGMPAGVGSGAAGNVWSTVIGAPSDGASLPQSTVNTNNNNYFSATGGTVSVTTSNGPQIVTYTGKSGGGALTGCTGGTGVMSAGGAVTNAIRVFGLDNLVNGPAGAAGAGGVNASLRNACLAVDPTETHAYICEYGNPNATYQIPALSDGVIAAGSALLYSASGVAMSATFNASAPITITVAGAGSAGGTLTAQITGVVRQSGSACWQLSAPALTTVTAATITFPSTTYGAGVVVGGPSVYHCANPGAAAGSVTWSKVVSFPGGKHAHAVKVINGLPWVSIGDFSAQFTDTGFWVASTLAGTTWTKRSNPANGVGNALDPINFIPVTVNGQAMVFGESDSGLLDGPLALADASGTRPRVLNSAFKMPKPYTQTMRSLTLLSNGNLIWVGTGEAQAVGPSTCIWTSRTPYLEPVLLEDVGALLDTETLGDPVVSNGYVWFGTFRFVPEKFLGQ